jgi:hypothetical protein
MWCCIALVPTFRSRVVRGLLIVYPWVTLFAIVVTANHYWLDALGGAFVLLVGYLLGSLLTRASARFRLARARRHLDETRTDEAHADEARREDPGAEGEAVLA